MESEQEGYGRVGKWVREGEFPRLPSHSIEIDKSIFDNWRGSISL